MCFAIGLFNSNKGSNTLVYMGNGLSLDFNTGLTDPLDESYQDVGLDNAEIIQYIDRKQCYGRNQDHRLNISSL